MAINTNHLNTQWGKTFTPHPIVSFDNHEYEYCKSDGVVTIQNFGRPNKESFISTNDRTLTAVATEKAEAEVSLPIPGDMETLKFLVYSYDNDVKFKFTMYDEKQDVTIYMNEAYIVLPTGYSLQSNGNNTFSVKGSPIQFL